MIKVSVLTENWAIKFVPERSVNLEMPTESTVADAMTLIGLPEDKSGIAVINGRAVPRHRVLADGEAVTIHPVVIGG